MMDSENFRLNDATFENVLESVTSVAGKVVRWDSRFYQEIEKVKGVIRNVADRYEQAEIYKRPADLPFIRQTMDYFDSSFLRMSRQMAAQNVLIRPVLDQCCEFLLLILQERGFREPEQEVKIKMGEIQSKILFVADCCLNRESTFKMIRDKLKMIIDRECLQSLCPYLSGRVVDASDFDRVYLDDVGDDIKYGSSVNSGRLTEAGGNSAGGNSAGDKANVNGGINDGVVHGANVGVTAGFGVDAAMNDVADYDTKEDVNNAGTNSDADIGDNANDDVIVGGE